VVCSTLAARAVSGARIASRSRPATGHARRGTTAPLAPPLAGRKLAAAAPRRPMPHRAIVPRVRRSPVSWALATTPRAAPMTRPTSARGKACARPATSAVVAYWCVYATRP
jgi:hypothetical protein